MGAPLPSRIISKMDSSEKKKLANLEAKYAKTGDEMLAAQHTATIAMRKEIKEKGDGYRSVRVQKLIDKGFKAEFLAFKAADELAAYKKSMRNRYA